MTSKITARIWKFSHCKFLNQMALTIYQLVICWPICIHLWFSTLSHLKHSTSEALNSWSTQHLKQTTYENILTNERNCSWQAISSFVIMFRAPLHNCVLSFIEIFLFSKLRWLQRLFAMYVCAVMGKGLQWSSIFSKMKMPFDASTAYHCLTLSLIWQFWSRRLWTYFVKT